MSDSNLPRDQAYIGGKWVEASDSRHFHLTDPANGSVLASVAVCSSQDTETPITAAQAAFARWRHLPGKERGARHPLGGNFYGPNVLIDVPSDAKRLSGRLHRFFVSTRKKKRSRWPMKATTALRAMSMRATSAGFFASRARSNPVSSASTTESYRRRKRLSAA